MNFFGSRYGLAGIFGDRENGKTTYLVKRLRSEADSRQDYDEFGSNIHVRDRRIPYYTYEEIKELKKPAPRGTPRMLLGIDQMHLLFDSRASGTKQNREFSQIIIESRQHGFDVLYNTWMRTSIDLRLRRFTPMNILAERVPGGFQYTFIDSEQGIKGVRTMSTEFAAKNIWPYFDTTELVQIA